MCLVYNNVEAQIENTCWHADEGDFETIVSCNGGAPRLGPNKAVKMSA